MKTTKKIINNIIGTKKPIKDSDGDGVTDSKDCQPFNTMRQDKIGEVGNKQLANWQQNMRKRRLI